MHPAVVDMCMGASVPARLSAWEAKGESGELNEVAVICAVSVHGIEWRRPRPPLEGVVALALLCSALLGEWTNGGAQSLGVVAQLQFGWRERERGEGIWQLGPE